MPHEIPPRKRPADDSGYFEELTRAIFQAGFSWDVIRDKWSGFQTAFDGFDLDTVASYGPPDVERLAADTGIVRNRRKIEATIQNARTMCDLVQEHGSFHAYLRSLDDLDYASRRKELSRRFKNLGPTGVFTFLWSVDEEVPPWDDRNK
ncbi:MAG: DNA-3-methyladenine glycosylase I [Anaerolineae bacterium]|nr:DNA-3-methyladenine glycosylase I [Anaerolineae bacterium]